MIIIFCLETSGSFFILLNKKYEEIIKKIGTAKRNHGYKILGKSDVCIATTMIDSINFVKSYIALGNLAGDILLVLFSVLLIDFDIKTPCKLNILIEKLFLVYHIGYFETSILVKLRIM